MALLKNLPLTAPADADQVSQGASEIRATRDSVWNYVTVEHNEDGKHLTGVDSGTANTYVVDLGNVPALATLGLFAGLKILFKPLSANTTTATLKIQVNAVDVGTAKTIKLAGNVLVADNILNGQWAEVIYDGTDWQLISGFGYASVINSIILKKVKQVTETISNSATAQNDDELVLPILANTSYIYEIGLFVSSASSADFRVGVSMTGVPALLGSSAIAFKSGTTVNITQVSSLAITTSGGIPLTYGYNPVNELLLCKGGFKSSASAGNFQVTWGQRTAVVASTSVLAGSYLLLHKV